MNISIDLINHLAKKTPLQEKLEALSDAFVKMVDVFLTSSESFDEKLVEICKRLLTVEVNMNILSANITGIKKPETSVEQKALAPPKNPPKKEQQIPKRSTNPRKEIIDELKRYFEKRNKK